MKLSNSTQSLETSITSAADFGIEDEDLSHIMGILRSQIYSDKLLAVIREYSTNAVDANIEAGNADKPIQVNMPTRTQPQLSFRDYGNGLTDEEVTQLYVKYGASTKRSSNDYTGCLGIGCKAAFAYGDAFQITSYTLAEKTTWLARIDESKRGTISLLSREPNHTEPTGVEVSITIRAQDFEECTTKARKFFKYWGPGKLSSNVEMPHIEAVHKSDDWCIANHQGIRDGSYRYNRHTNGSATVVMGNIAYPVPASEFKDNNIHGLQLIHSSNVIFYASLGSLDIAANREALELTDRTRTGIIAMANNMMLDLTKNLEDEVASSPTRIHASLKALLYEDSLGRQINNTIASRAQWKGLTLIRHITLKNGKKAVVHRRERSWRSSSQEDRNIRDKDVTLISLDPNVTLCVTDNTITEANSTRRIRTLQDQSGYKKENKYAVIQREDLDDIEPKLEKDDYLDLLTIEPLKPNRTIIPKQDGDKVKSIRINVCTLKPDSLKSARLSKECEPTAMDDGRFVYIPLDRFDWDGHRDRLDNLNWLIENLAHINDDKKITIHGVKKHHVSKLNDKWITFDAFYKERLDAERAYNPKDYKFLADALVLSSEHAYQHWFGDVDSIARVKDKAISYQAQVMQKSLKGEPSVLSVAKYLGVYEPKSTIVKDLQDTIAKYPLLKTINVGYYTDIDKDTLTKELNHYIQSK